MNATTISGVGLDQATVIPPAPEKRGSIEDPNVPITYAQLSEIISGGPTESGEYIGPRTSLKIIAVLACVQVISRAIARMPLITYERTAGGRQRATGHPNYELLKMRPNPDMSSFTFRQTLIANTLLWGNGYAEIVRRRDGSRQALIPIESERVSPFRENGELMYRVLPASGSRGQSPVTLLKRDMLHVVGLTLDGVVGMSVIEHARTTLGASRSRDKFSASFYQNGTKPSGVLKHPQKLSTQAYKNLRESFTEKYTGAANAYKPIILEEGMEFSPTSMPLDDAQFIETHYASIEDVARLFGVPPHKIGHLLRATNNNIEQQSLDFLGDTLAPWIECAEQELNWKMFDEGERERYYAEHLTQVLVQMDAKTRGEWYERMHRIGAMSDDEIRERENLNNLPDGRGKQYYVPSNLMPAPTPEQADKLMEGWITKGKPAGSPAAPGEPNPTTNDQVAKSG